MQANPEIDWIASVHYFILQPAAIPAEYQGSIPYLSFGYEPDSITALDAGTLTTVFAIEPVSMGRVGIGTAISLLEGEEVPRVNCLPAPTFTADSVGNTSCPQRTNPGGLMTIRRAGRVRGRLNGWSWLYVGRTS